MKTAEEILRSHSEHFSKASTHDEAVKAMKEYAKQVAKETLNKAARTANVLFIDGKTKEESSRFLIYSGANCIMPNADMILNTEIITP